MGGIIVIGIGGAGGAGPPLPPHKHYFVERQLPSGIWVSEERCSLRDSLAELQKTVKVLREEERRACAAEKARLN